MVATLLVRETPHLTLSSLSRLRQSPPSRRSDFKRQLEKARKLLDQRLRKKASQARKKGKRK